MQFLTGRGYFLFVAEKPSPMGESGPKGRMRGECASIARERAAAKTLPSSVTCGDSFLYGGSLQTYPSAAMLSLSLASLSWAAVSLARVSSTSLAGAFSTNFGFLS